MRPRCGKHPAAARSCNGPGHPSCASSRAATGQPATRNSMVTPAIGCLSDRLTTRKSRILTPAFFGMAATCGGGDSALAATGRGELSATTESPAGTKPPRTTKLTAAKVTAAAIVGHLRDRHGAGHSLDKCGNGGRNRGGGRRCHAAGQQRGRNGARGRFARAEGTLGASPSRSSGFPWSETKARPHGGRGGLGASARARASRPLKAPSLQPSRRAASCWVWPSRSQSTMAAR